MDWFSLIIGLVIGFLIGKFWTPISVALKAVQKEVQKVPAIQQNQQQVSPVEQKKPYLLTEEDVKILKAYKQLKGVK